MEKRILLTAFHNTSSQMLLEDAEETTLILPNDKQRDSQILLELLSSEQFDYILSLGQKPNIRDKLYIETTARKGDGYLVTDVDCEQLQRLFQQHGISARISNRAGTSYCNELYWNGLQHLTRNVPNTHMVCLHIPFEKNLDDPEDFRRKFRIVVRCIREGQL